MEKRIERILLITIWLCLGLGLFVPLIGTNLVMYSTVFAKATYFQIFVEIAFAVWFVLVWAKPAYRPPWRHPLVIAVGAYLLVLLLTMSFALDPSRSFWSSNGRMMGVVNYLHYGAYFLVLYSVLKNWIEWKRWLIGLNVGAIIVDFIAYYQMATSEAVPRSFATFGNPAHFAAYALLSVFVAVLLAYSETRRGWWIVWLSTAFMHATALVLSGARAGLLGLMAGMFVLLVLLVLTSNSKKRRRAIAAVLIGVVLLGAGSFITLRTIGSAWGHEHLPLFMSRVVYSGLDEARLSHWTIALQGIKARPIVGWGIEGYTAVFDRYLDPTGRDAAVPDTWADRAHNQYLDVAVGNGLFGLAAYLAMWAVAFVLLARNLRKGTEEKRKNITTPLLSLFVAWLVHQFFLFDVPASTVSVFFLLALAARQTTPTAQKEKTGRALPHARLVAIGVVVSLCAALYFINLLPFAKAMENKRGADAFMSNRIVSFEAFEASLEPRSYLIHDLRMQMVTSLNDAYNYWRVAKDPLKDSVLLARDEMRLSAEARPYDLRTLGATAFVTRLAGMYDATNFDEAEHLAERMLEIAPERAEPYLAFGEIALDRGDSAEAVSWFEQALARVQKHDRGEVLARLTCAYAADRQFDKAFATRDEAEAEKFDMDSEVRFVVALAPVLDDPAWYPAAVEILERQLLLFGMHDELYASAAIIYYRSGDMEKFNLTMEALEKRGTGWDGYVRATLGL